MRTKVIFTMILAATVVALAAPGPVGAGEVFRLTSNGARLEILTREDFEARFGNNPQVPKTDEETLELASRLFTPLAEETPAVEERAAGCRTPELLLLTAALKNPAVSDETRLRVDRLMAEEEPELPRVEVFKHFRFHWTQNNSNPLHNVTREEIRALSLYLNKYWDVYTGIFGILPKSEGPEGDELIDVKVYYFGTLGGTEASNNYIQLNSASVVKNPCMRRTVSAHELFHRVQFSCGLNDPYPGVMWLAEGTAVWATKWALTAAAVAPVYEYIKSMRKGLAEPDKNLLLKRDYDAAHFWVYLAQRAGWEAIRDVWLKYMGQKNGKDPRAAAAAVVREKLGMSFDLFLHHWHKTNYIQALANAEPKYDYVDEAEPHTACGRTYQLGRVGIDASHKIPADSTSFAFSGRVAPYGADYFRFALGDRVTRVRIRVTGEAAGNFSYFFMGVRSNKGQTPIKQTFAKSCEYARSLSPGQWDSIILIVAGRSEGGHYLVEAIPGPGAVSCIDGYWQADGSVEKWHLGYHDGHVTGSYIGFSEGCTLLVSGKYSAPNIQFTTTDPARQDCYRVSIKGILAGCRKIYGTRTTRYDTKGSPVVLKKVVDE